MKKLINLRDHCTPESVCRQTRKSLTQLKRPLIRILSGAMLHLKFLDLHTLPHLQRNLLIEDLPWTPHQLFLLCRKTVMVSKVSLTKRRQSLTPLR
jgi:hypothetical protein